MKFYFCGSIRGGRDRAALYGRMVERMKARGPVLTEHVADPALTEHGGDGEDGFIWRRDTAWLRECDAVIAECSVPSLGVGYELAYAEALGKPCFVFYLGEDSRLSAMIAGDPHFDVRRCQTEEQLLAALDEVLAGLGE